jgi:RNA polymerase sigma-70 factor (ECF subfamily)
MDIPSKNEITQWLADCKGAKGEAFEQLLPLVYDELHRRAVQLFSQESAGHTLQRKMDWQNRAQFFALAARMMRRILVSHARRRKAAKRGGGETRITLADEVAAAPERDVNLLAVDEALTKLDQIDPDKSRMVELRFFSGLSVEETAEMMGVSPRTINRQWQTTKAWLYRELATT